MIGDLLSGCFVRTNPFLVIISYLIVYVFFKSKFRLFYDDRLFLSFFLSPLSFLFYYHIPKHVDLEDLSLKKQELSVLFIYQGYRYWEVDYEIIIIVISDFETWYFMNNFL